VIDTNTHRVEVTPCRITSWVNHLGSDLVDQLEVAGYVPCHGHWSCAICGGRANLTVKGKGHG
jgi:hypothetical protein